MDEEFVNHMFRKITAELTAQKFIIDYLLRHAWIQIPRTQRLKLAEGLLDASVQTDHLRGIAENDDLFAAALADVTVLMQQLVDQYVGRALKATAEAEDEAARQRFREDENR